MLKLRQRPYRSLLNTGNRATRGGTQADGDRDCFFVVEQQGRQRTVRAQPVPAGNPWSRIDGIAELP